MRAPSLPLRCTRGTSATVVVLAGALAWSAPLAAQRSLDRGGDTPSAVASAWSEASWRADLEREVNAARAARPDAEARLYRLEGLRPDVYRARRRPEPEVARELSRLVEKDVVPAALLAALALALDDGSARYPFSTAEQLPKHTPDEVKRLAAMEREQLHAGLLLALADARHPSAFYVARASLTDDARALEQRRAAAIALGKTRDARAIPLLTGIARADKAPLALRTAALAGLAHVRSLDAVLALEDVSRTSDEVALQRAAAVSLGNAASAWALRAGDVAQASEMRARASSALVELLIRTGDEGVASAVVDALGVVADQSAAVRLRALAKDERSSAAVRERALRAERRLERALRRATR